MHLERIKSFLDEIGIPVRYAEINEDTFLPGILIDRGSIVVDKSKLLYPGDVLHEAGHVAVMFPNERINAHGNVGEIFDYQRAMGDEITAIAWSYAALLKIGIPPEVVFHPDGYKGSSDWYIVEFTSGNYIGLPTLQWMGFCYDEKNAPLHNTKPYPHMVKWLREQPTTL